MNDSAVKAFIITLVIVAALTTILFIIKKVHHFTVWCKEQLKTGGLDYRKWIKKVCSPKPSWHNHILPINTPKCDRCHIGPATKTNASGEKICKQC